MFSIYLNVYIKFSALQMGLLHFFFNFWNKHSTGETKSAWLSQTTRWIVVFIHICVYICLISLLFLCSLFLFYSSWLKYTQFTQFNQKKCIWLIKCIDQEISLKFANLFGLWLCYHTTTCSADRKLFWNK